MKRFFPLVLACLFALAGCAKPNDTSALQPPTKEGVAPYAFSEQETELLRSFGVPVNAQAAMLSFCAPEEAVSMHVNACRLTEDKSWAITIIDDVSIGAEGEPVHPLAGFLTMEVLEDSSIDFHVNCAGLSSFRTEAFVPEEPRFSQAVVSLSEHTKIVLDEEIPVALITYTEMGKSMRIPSLEDCRDPSAFENTDFVQMITLMFTAEAS